MAHYTVQYTIQSCPKCGKKLLKVQTGTYRIGSPLLDCKACGITYRTPLRVEWYQYPGRKTLFAIPAIMAVAGFLMGALMEDLAIGILVGIFCLILGICILIPNVIRILASIKRMRDPAYLQRLLRTQVITPAEYQQLLEKAN